MPLLESNHLLSGLAFGLKCEAFILSCEVQHAIVAEKSHLHSEDVPVSAAGGRWGGEVVILAIVVEHYDTGH